MTASTLLALVLLFVGGCATVQKTELQRFEFEQPQMGLSFQIVLYAPDAATAQGASDAAFARISQLNSNLSDYDYDSELSRLSRTSGSGTAVKVSDDLWTVLNTAQQISSESRGAFDVTVGPVVNLWRKARRDKKFPDAKRLDEARKAVGFQHMTLHPETRSVTLRIPNMRLDLGGIAKGYAIDEAMKVLRGKGIRHAMVSGGGDLAVSDPPPGKPGWKIEIPAEGQPSAASKFIHLQNQAMATSGDLFQFVELGGKRYSHIVDPRTGVGLVNQMRVVVVAETATTADALSTSISVLGASDGLRLARKFPNTQVYLASSAPKSQAPEPEGSASPQKTHPQR